MLARLSLALAGSSLVAAPLAAQSLDLLTLGLGGVPANGATGAVEVSADGRFIAFESTASNLVASDTNGAVRDVFLHDRQTGLTTLVSQSTYGTQSTFPALLGGVSDDGRVVSFLGNGLEMTSADVSDDIYSRDMLNGVTLEWSNPADPWSAHATPQMGGGGRFVATLRWNTLFGCETRLFVHDIQTGQATQIENHTTCYHGGSDITGFSVSDDGTELVYSVRAWSPNITASIALRRIQFPSLTPVTVYQSAVGWNDKVVLRAVSNDGTLLVLWKSRVLPGGATLRKLVEHDVPTGTQSTIATGLAPGLTDGPFDVRISADKRYIAFVAADSHLVPDDTNGVADAFLFDRTTDELRRISLDTAETQASGATVSLDLDASLSALFLSSAEASWAPGDTNGAADLFRRDACFTHSPDADLDGFGSSAGTTVTCLPAPAGWRFSGGDCDDTRASVNPLGIESCNGLDDDCDGNVDEGFGGVAYCAETPTAIGCTPLLQATGCLSATQPAGFTLSLSGAPSNRPGLFLYGFAAANQTWVPGNPSVLCVAAPRQRTTMQTTSTVNACGGQFAFDFPAWAALHPGALGLPLAAGQVVHFQGWLRETGYPGGTMLTQAWQVAVAP